MNDLRTLEIDGIRLLKIHPKLRDGYIACTLNQYHDFRFSPPYDALSYYWGDPKPTRNIWVNNSIVAIHEALWEFLDQMQRSQETETWIWTDFLCLNQRNNEEIGQQIPRMGQIYSQAQRTISWLGCNRSSWVYGLSSHSLDLEEDLRLIAEKVTARGAAVESFFAQPKLLRWTNVIKLMVDGNRAHNGASLGRSELDQLVARIELPKPIKEVAQLSQGHMIRPILNALSMPYWTRVWIAQEIALAKKVMLMFGSVNIDFDNFLLTYKAYFYYMLQKVPRDCVKPRVPIEARAAVYENNVSFQQVVRWGQDCDATKPVDRIYGLLGLLARCGDGTSRLPTTLTGPIDYTRDLREVYWDTALMSPFSIDASTMDENDQIEVIERWVDLLPALGQVLDCPFAPRSLRYADNERATRLCRSKASLALSLVDLCRIASIIDSNISIKQADTFSRESWRLWPTKRCAHRLWSDASKTLKGQTLQFQRLLASLLLETSRSRGIDANDEYQAAIIALVMSKKELCRGWWKCVSNQSISNSTPSAPGNEVNLSFDCSIGPAASQLPCSLSITGASCPRPWHQCLTLDRYLEIDCPWQRATWKLSLEDLCFRKEEGCWKGTLNVKYLIL